MGLKFGPIIDGGKVNENVQEHFGRRPPLRRKLKKCSCNRRATGHVQKEPWGRAPKPGAAVNISQIASQSEDLGNVSDLNDQNVTPKNEWSDFYPLGVYVTNDDDGTFQK